MEYWDLCIKKYGGQRVFFSDHKYLNGFNENGENENEFLIGCSSVKGLFTDMLGDLE